jgi:acyl dehydratase
MGASEQSGAVESEIVFRLPVEPGKVREFALAVAEDNPIHYDADEARRQGLPDIVAPPTFTVTQMWQVPREERERRLGANLAYDRVLHGEQEFFYRRLPVAGEVLDARMRIASDLTKRGRRGGTMRVVTYESVFTDSLGEEVVRALYTLMELPLPEEKAHP